MSHFHPRQVQDIANKLVEIASDSALRKELKEKGLERSKVYTWDACSEKTAGALRANL